LALLSAVRRDVDARLAGFLDAKRDAARKQGKEVGRLVSAVSDLCLRGGKRLRPALLAVGYRVASASADLEPALDAGVALELLHAYFLIHDDWMDGDAMRRGGPAVHALLAKQLGSQQKGDASAILAGDYALAMATEALSRVECPPSRLLSAFACFAQMQLDAVAGQQLDLLGARDIVLMYTLKTASYTVLGPLRLGAQLVGGSPQLLGAMTRFALPVGIAFQLRDDLLNAFGDPDQTGKPFAGDLKRGKRTWLNDVALTLAKGKQRQLLKRALGNPNATMAELRRAVAVLDGSGARERVERQIEKLTSDAIDALARAPLQPRARRLLQGAAWALTARQN
jgi:geranylgeranyl diphosphate synthase type I